MSIACASVVLSLMLVLAPAATALAADGVVEINQACALAGCFAGDAAGFPVSITSSGSYVLTSDLAPGATDAISIPADDVTVDLNGFTIAGTGLGRGVDSASAFIDVHRSVDFADAVEERAERVSDAAHRRRFEYAGVVPI